MRLLVVRTSLILLGLFLLYFVYLLFLGYRTYSVINDARSIYQTYSSEGLTTEVEKNYQELLPRVAQLRNNLESPLVNPVVQITGRSAKFREAIALYDYIAPALPGLTQFAGATSPKRYLVAFQNSAEARGTGGIIGAFAILRLDKGEITIERVGSNYILQHAPKIPIKMPEEFYRIYREDPAIWMNSNMSPHFPYGAKIWLALWKAQFNDNLDGVIALDPIVLSHFLTVTGPVRAQGKEITSSNVVQESLSDAYLRFEKDNFARKSYLVAIIEAVAQAILAPTTDRIALAQSLTEPILDNRVLLFSVHSEIQKTIAASNLSGSMRKNSSNEYRLVIQNTAGNKMDYYLDRKLAITSLACGNNSQTAVNFTLTNTAEKDSYLPAYVKGRLDIGRPEGQKNSTAITAFLYGPPRASLLSSVDSQTNGSAGFLKLERGRTALTIPLVLQAGESRSFSATFEGGTGPLTSHLQPLVRPQRTTIVDRCSK